ncbi:MAG: hypothetical protein JKY55_16940 [Aliivibrio sp.]|uniref:hypothetical protein n=1 Tax=Aliivibrio sp. TaxID=1872443 RepID=UPI001A52CE19|nr:hypothetical protein [Aliivibrio sp.]
MTTINIDSSNNIIKTATQFTSDTPKWMVELELTEKELLSERRDNPNDELNLILNRKRSVIVGMKYLLIGLTVGWLFWS